MQRLHEDDLVGHVLDLERRLGLDIEPKWIVVRFPAIAEQEETHVVRRFGESVTYKRQVGEVLHREREPREILDQLRETLGEYHFAGQYQQSPAPLGGGMVKHHWLQSYTEADRPEKFDSIFQSWDTANKASELSDYSVCTTWGVINAFSANAGSGTSRLSGRSSAGTERPDSPATVDTGVAGVADSGRRTSRTNAWGLHNGRVFLLHVLRCKMEFPELKRAVVDQAALWGANNILIEDKSSGTQLAQDLIFEGMHGIVRCPCTADKIMRMNNATSTIENGFVYLPEKAPWLGEYIHELVTFPHGKHDDQVDSTSQALNWLKARLTEPGIVTYYRNLNIADWQKRYISWEHLGPEVQQYVIQNNIEGPRPGNQYRPR